MNRNFVTEPPDRRINKICKWHGVIAQTVSHYFLYSDSVGRAFAACGWRATVSDLLEDTRNDACPRCAIVLYTLGKENS